MVNPLHEDQGDLSRDAIELRILGGGRNWVQLTSQLALSLACYEGFLPKGSTVNVTASDPGSTCMDSPRLVADRRYDVAITSPLWYGEMAVKGTVAFDEPLPLRALAHIPHDDRLLFAVKTATGLRSFDDITEQKYPLRVMMPEPALRHPATWITEDVLRLHHLSMEDIISWGGALVPTARKRTRGSEGSAARQNYDAVFDEAVMTRRWKELSSAGDLTYLSLSEDAAATLAERGIDLLPIPEGKIPDAPSGLRAVDFSGWLLFCHEALDEDVAYSVVASLVEQAPAIHDLFRSEWAGLTGKLDPQHLAQTGEVPLHPGAARFYRDAGIDVT